MEIIELLLRQPAPGLHWSVTKPLHWSDVGSRTAACGTVAPLEAIRGKQSAKLPDTARRFPATFGSARRFIPAGVTAFRISGSRRFLT